MANIKNINPSTETVNIVIDTDAGLDDAQAIMMILGCKNVGIKCISTVDGNAPVDNVCMNVIRTLREAERLDIPVYRGCRTPMVRHTVARSIYHGKDGFGDYFSHDQSLMDRIQQEHAVTRLINLSKEYPGELVIIALGPLTNLAMAIRMDPDFTKRLQACFIMGGNHSGIGNSSPHGEFNFSYDPEAAYIVMTELKCPIQLVCWEVCLDYHVKWNWYVNVLLQGNSKCVNLIKAVERDLRYDYYKGDDQYFFADQIIAAVFLYPEIVLASENLRCNVILDGQARGMMTVDRRQPALWVETENWPTVNVITSINLELFLKKMVESIHSLP